MRRSAAVLAVFLMTLASIAVSASAQERRRGARRRPRHAPRAAAAGAQAAKARVGGARAMRGVLTPQQLLGPAPRRGNLPPETHTGGPPPVPPRDAPGGPDRDAGEPQEPAEKPSTSTRSPALAGSTFDASALGSLDPQIAVSKKYVLVASGDSIAMYDRSGTLLAARGGGTLENPLSTTTLFKPLWGPDNPENVNTFLNLPSGLKCNPKKDFTKPGNEDATRFCLNDFYDARLRFDEKRNRFWIVALARNAAAKYDEDGNAVTDPNILMARRSYLFVAVSVTEDPRDGFYVYWWNGAIDMGACNQPLPVQCANSSQFIPGDAGDYPIVAVGDEYFVETHNVNNVMGARSYGLVTVALADELAKGRCDDCAWNYWDLTDEDDEVVSRLAPVQPQGTPSPDMTFITHIEGKRLLLWGLLPGGTHAKPPSLLRASAGIKRSFTAAKDPPKLPGNVAGGAFFSNITAGAPLSAVHHNDKVYIATHDCAHIDAAHAPSSCTTSIRFFRVNVGTFPLAAVFGLPTDDASGFLDETFGLRGWGDADDAVVYYGVPALAVNKNGDIVLVYQRAGSTTYPEARYNVWDRKAADLLSGRDLHTGDLSISVRVDTGGIALDPSDDETVWMAHAYASRAAGRAVIAVGHVKP